jgi:thiamine-phosphate pyrophosphorylase
VRGLYPIVDATSLARRGLPLLEFAEQVLKAKPAVLQLRAKHATSRETLAMLRALRSLCLDAGTLLFANDRADLALLAECDGVHVGQHDLSVGEVRRIAPALKVGVSTHVFEELERALVEQPDYVAFGPVFRTTSKEQAEPVVGLSALARAGARCAESGCPLVAIGGIDEPRARQVAGVAGLGAVIAALLPEGADLAEVGERALRLQAALRPELASAQSAPRA